MTLVGDVAQSTAPGGQERWNDVLDAFAEAAPVTKRGVAGPPGSPSAPLWSRAVLSIGYRVPEPILGAANELLPFTGVDATASRSVRTAGSPPRWIASDEASLGPSVARVVADVKHRHRLTGVVAPVDRHDAVTAALAAAGLAAVDHVHQLGHDDVPLFGPEQVKGLEFDGVVVVEPDEILDGTPRGARLLYVAMTRAVQELAIVTTGAPELRLPR
jgi:DNA helicase IV